MGMTGIAMLLVMLFASPSWAHRPVLSGDATCPSADHVITWSIGNNLKKQPMTIMSATAVLDTNSTTYAVTGYTNPVDYGAPTSATTVVPGDLTGTVTLTIVGLWPDGITNPKTAVVALADPCAATTTTTTAPPTTTTVPGSTTTTAPTVTTAPNDTTTTGVVPAPGSDVSACTATSNCKQLAYTDNNGLYYLRIGGLVALALGLIAMIFALKDRTVAERRGL